MQFDSAKSLPPSFMIEVLRKAIGKRVISLTRYSWWSAEDAVNECNIDKKYIFSMTYGPLGVEFEDGTVIAVAEEPSLNSVIVWLDRLCSKAIRQPTLDEDKDFFPIDSKDRNFSQNFFEEIIGKTLISLSIIKLKSASVLMQELPSEVGLIFKFDNGSSFVASRGLHEIAGDFAVISYEQIPENIRENLIEQNLI